MKWIVPAVTYVALATTPVAAGDYEPIYVVFSYHLDPLGPNPRAARINYPQHRDAVQWTTALSLSTGMKLSAAGTGPYTEACVLNGHEADFTTFMPGEHNTLGTHLHAHRKLPQSPPYGWQEVPQRQRTPEVVAEIFADQIFYVNQIFTGLGRPATDNQYFHGTHANSPGIMDDLYRFGGVRHGTYPNVFAILHAPRGLYHPYRGDAEATKENLGGFYTLIPIASGIAGEDRVHGPEGMVYGTLPYLKKDFVIEYLEWRFAQSHGLLDRIWVYGWGAHPYQTTPTYRGTDGVLTRLTIQRIIGWLNDNFVEKESGEGNVIARYATYLNVRDRFKAWEIEHPGESSIHGDPKEGPYRELPATAELLATSYYDNEIVVNPSVEVHRFVDREDDTVRYVVWTDSPPRVLDLSNEVSGLVAVIDHEGEHGFADSRAIDVAGDPLVIVAAIHGDFDLDGDVDLDDFAVFAPCMAGPGLNYTDPDCRVFNFDFELDRDVDLADFAALGEAFTGSH